MAQTWDATIWHEPRLRALRRSGLLDTPPEEAFDRLTRLVCRLLKAPAALLSLVDADRQFLKSAIGLPEPWATRRETPLSHSVCQHVVACGAPLLIHDARSHPLVRDSLAVPELGVVAYLGMPLALPEGQVIGALAAIDRAPRAWTAEEVEALRRLTGELETRVAEAVAAREAARAKAQRREALGQLVGSVADTSPRGTRFADSILLARAAVAGQGLALLRDTYATDEIAAGRLQVALDAPWPAQFAYYVVTARGPRSPAVKAFSDWLMAEAADES